MFQKNIKTPRSAKWKHFEGFFLNRCLIFEVRKGPLQSDSKKRKKNRGHKSNYFNYSITSYLLPNTSYFKIWGYSSAGRAPALQAGGQRFDPAYLHQIWAHSSGG